MGEGQASRTNHASRGSVGAGRARPPRSRAMDAHQPVAPVPVETIRPDEDWRSARPSGVGELVPGRLVRGVPDENLVEPREFLAVVEPRCHRGEFLAAQPFRRAGQGCLLQQPRRRVGRVPDQDARIGSRLRIDPDDGLAVEILRRVGHQPVLAHHGDDVLRGEQEAAQVRAFHLGVTPFGRNRGADGGQGRGEPVMALLHVLDAAAPGAEEEFGLAAGGVPVQQFLELGPPVDDDEAGVCHDADPTSGRTAVAAALQRPEPRRPQAP